ncbi:MAG TPA: Ppx/GppA phosphatase family protein [Candidatus Eremiobacteraceae bacterium]|nr:Ppx/GppA phosphatase family protein [Candidatus Eremiobacteraceae bacterium]
MRAAVISAGSNSCRLLIARIDADQPHVEHHDIRITRLGEGVSASGVLSPPAMERSLAAIEEFAQLGKQADRLLAIGTAALREAKNASDFIARVRQITGVEMRVLSGEEEARASFDGALWALDRAGRTPAGAVTVIDIGGRSTEFASRAQPADRVTLVSLPLGAVRMTERFFKHDPPRAEELNACRTAVRMELHAAPAQSVGNLVFVGGTADTTARMLYAYDPTSAVHVGAVRRADLEDLLRLTSSLPLEQRKRLHGLPESRAEIFPAGLAIIDEIVSRAGVQEFTVSESDLLVGFLLETIRMG